MDEFEYDINENQEQELLVARFKKLVQQKEQAFFDVEQFEILIQYFIEEDHLTLACHALEMGLSQHPSSLDIKIHQVNYFITVGKLNKALTVLTRIQAVESTNSEIYCLFAEIYGSQRQPKKAIENYKLALQFNPENRIEVLQDLVAEYENADMYDEALVLLKDIYWQQPENETLGFELLYCFTMADKEEEAVEYFEAFTSEYPYQYMGWFNYGSCFAKLELFEKAIWAFDFCTVIDPDISLGYFQKALMQIELEQLDEAVQTYHDLLEIFPDNSNAYTFLAECHEKLDEYDLAMHNYLQAIKHDDRNPEAWLGIGVVYDLMNEPEKAIPPIRKALSIIPESSNYKFVLAEALHKAGYLADAFAMYNEALDQDPDNVLGILDYANLLEEHSSLPKALEYLELKMIEVPADAMLEFRHSVYMFKTGHMQQGYESFTKGLLLDFDQHQSVFTYYPEAINLAQLNVLIDLHKNKE